MPYLQNVGFGSGVMFATPIIGAVATPIRLGIMQDVSVDFSFSTKQLFGQYQYPVSIGRGQAKVTGKAKFARIDSEAITQLYFNLTPTVGQIQIADSEPGTVPGAGPYTVTVNHSAAFSNDLGVAYATTGQPLKAVASAPAAGQYMVSAGEYTFAAGDANAAVLVSYGWNDTSNGSSTIITNPLLGASTPFQVDFYQTDPNVTQQWGLRLYACLSSKLSIATKQEDYTIPEFDFEAYANAANQIGAINLPTS